MTPQEKALDLVSRFCDEVNLPPWCNMASPDYFVAKQCAIICVDEILNLSQDGNYLLQTTYWQSVKEEIQNGF